MFCKKCDSENLDSAKFCKKCGGNLLQTKNQFSQDESQTKLFENNVFANKKKIIIALSGIAILGVTIFGGTAIYRAGQKSQVATEVPANPTNEKQAIPKEAQDFVNQYGDRYSDPVSTYYAEKDYKATVDKYGSMMTNDYINKFEITNLSQGDVDQLGFTNYMLPLSAEDNQQTAVNVFNSYTAKNLSLYMNLLAKNPSLKAKDIIDSELQNYCSNTSADDQQNIAFSADNEAINKLMNTAKTIVAKYGSAANYSVAKASIDTSDPNTTEFPESLTAVETFEFRGQKIKSLHSSGVRLVINVDSYNGKNVTHTIETLKDVQLSIIRQPDIGSNSTYISIGQER